jgi:hypothetical protein
LVRPELDRQLERLAAFRDARNAQRAGHAVHPGRGAVFPRTPLLGYACSRNHFAPNPLQSHTAPDEYRT